MTAKTGQWLQDKVATVGQLGSRDRTAVSEQGRKDSLDRTEGTGSGTGPPGLDT
jgi:hypothetical protein